MDYTIAAASILTSVRAAIAVVRIAIIALLDPCTDDPVATAGVPTGGVGARIGRHEIMIITFFPGLLDSVPTNRRGGTTGTVGILEIEIVAFAASGGGVEGMASLAFPAVGIRT